MSQHRSSPEPQARQSAQRWHFLPQLKKFVIFQLKLYIDAIRDLFLSFLSLLAFLLDVILQRQDEVSYFEQVLRLGRRSEKAINLFNQHDPEAQHDVSVDGVIRSFEERMKK